jgi:hypothetical protein
MSRRTDAQTKWINIVDCDSEICFLENVKQLLVFGLLPPWNPVGL